MPLVSPITLVSDARSHSVSLVRHWARSPVEVPDGVLRDDARSGADDRDRAGECAVGERAVEHLAAPNRE